MLKKNELSILNNFFESPLLVFLALSFVCLLGYANSFQNQFMLDDHLILFGQHGVIHKSFGAIFTSNQGDFYRPVGHLPLWVLSHLLASNYVGYHLANFVLFVLMVFLVFVIVRKISSCPTLSFISALFYAIHPFNGMVINYITASIIAVFVLSMQLSFLCFMSFAESGQKRYGVLSLVLFILACLSHEMAIMLPMYLAAYLFFIKKEGWKKTLLLLSPFIVILTGWILFRLLSSFFPHQLSQSFYSIGNLSASFTTWMDLLIWYLTNLFFPSKVIFLWSVQYGQEHLGRDVIMAALGLSLVVYGFLQWKRTWKSFLLAVFILGLCPTVFACFVNFPIVWPIIEPHWFYFSQIGFFVLLAGLVLMMVRKNFLIGGVLGGVVILFYLMNCWSYNDQWKTQEKYSLYWLSLNTGNLTPYYGLGQALMDRGDYKQAATLFSVGYKRLNYGTAQMASDWGHCLDMLGYDKEALSWLKEGISKDSQLAITYHYLGLYYQRKGNLLEAQKAFKKAIELDPTFSP
jgi:hypothetical protein